ncbi:Nuclear speckle splicing regulatory protein 1, partial [Operophtera brumata]
AAHNVFGNDSDSEGESSKKRVLLRPSDIIKRQKAISEDPTVYQYDEIYEEMVGTKEKEKIKTKEEKKPRYIENLMKSANKRKIENERRMERQIQKEREEEGEEFKGKEVFVTSAYKKKLEELRLEEEKEKREEYLERIGDLGTDKTTESKPTIKPDKETTETPVPDIKEQLQTDNSKKRNYRKRKSSDLKYELSDGEIEDSEDDHEINRLNLENIRLAKKSKVNEENIDADSDFSVDDPSEGETEKEEASKENTSKTVDVTTPKRSVTPEIKPVIEKDDKKSKNVLEDIEEKPKIDIWKKRTVGDVFDQALKRYYERKANRGC